FGDFFFYWGGFDSRWCFGGLADDLTSDDPADDEAGSARPGTYEQLSSGNSPSFVFLFFLFFAWFWFFVSSLDWCHGVLLWVSTRL
ncbi:MAG: hypothetical protein GTO63_05945, partial [Anaerolineae bacterium]|nr:hypothetical protein [Anaerolineae bacterium]